MLSLAADGSSVHSNQDDVHEKLQQVVARHRHTVYQAPIATHTRTAFDALSARLAEEQRAIVLDSGCGVGESTRYLAEHHPDAWVIGIDKSAHRLAKQGVQDLYQEQHCFYVRANLVDFWRLAQSAGWRLQHHYLLYPNPWPKSEHLKRRWHGHSVFPSLLALGGELELRTNWRLYLAEFKQALAIYGYSANADWEFKPETEITAFERKYRARKEPLYRLRVNLNNVE